MKCNIYLVVVLFAGKNGELVAARAILGQELVTTGESGVVEKAIEGGDGLRADQANTGGGQDGARDGHALGQEDLSDGVDIDVVVENVLLRVVELNVHGADQRVVDLLNGDLVLLVLDVETVVRHVGAIEVTEQVLELVGSVVDERRQLKIKL